MLGTAQQVKEMLRSAENEPGSIQSDATAMSRILDRLQSQQGLTPEQRSLLEEFSALESTIDTLAAGGQVSNEEALDFNTLRAAERDLINDERAKMLDEQPGGNVLAGQQVSPNIVQEAILDLVDKISELIPILRIGNQNQALMAEKLNTSLMQNAAANDRVNTTAQQTGGIVAFNPGAR